MSERRVLVVQDDRKAKSSTEASADAAPLAIPSDYVASYERGRAADPARARNYIVHTMIGDPLCDEMMVQLEEVPLRESDRFVRAAIEDPDDPALKDAPAAVHAFIEELETVPDWVDYGEFAGGVRAFHRDSAACLAAMLGGVLVEGFSTTIAKSFFITGRLRDQGVRRLRQNNRHMIELFVPGGMDRGGDGWKLSARVRLVHAQVRHLLRESEEWDKAAWGEPISAAHVGFSISAFSARLLKHMESLGSVFNDEERESFMAVWRYSGLLMGIPETILFKTEEEALRIFETGRLCEPPPSPEAVSMAHSLVNSAPLVIGIDDPGERRGLAKYVFSVSRALIGNDLADGLNYPPGSTLGVLEWFRIQAKYERILDRFVPRGMRNRNFSNFTSLLEASMFDAAGISYRMPDHVYAEESSKW
jgi:hypothetical protein